MATAAGVTCRHVDEVDRLALLQLANERERAHPDETYRVTTPRNSDLLHHNCWLVAESSAGQPLLLAVLACDGEFAVLRYFRTLGDTEAHSLSRYAAHLAIMEGLATKGVRWLLDNEPPGAQTNGVRLFQRIVGFRYKYVRTPCVPEVMDVDAEAWRLARAETLSLAGRAMADG